MRYYLAARFSRKDELAGYAQIIEDHGDTVTSRWLTGAHDPLSERQLTHQELRDFAFDDLDDIGEASCFVLFTEAKGAGYMSGGRMVEFGYALNMGNKYLSTIVVGPQENIFTRLATEHYASWDDLAAEKGWKS